jgi:hypothetical protein
MLKITHTGARKKKNLVIFIHGLTGDELTWINQKGNSFADMLYWNKEIKKKFDIGHFSYHSKFYSLNNARNLIAMIWKSVNGSTGKVEINLDIPNITDLLRTELELRAQDYEEIVLIGHSLGGLISKSVILKIISENSATAPKISKFISLAVPHNGSELAAIASIIFRNPHINNLKPIDSEIYRLTDSWLKAPQEKLPDTTYFQGKIDFVVKPTSSVGFENKPQKVLFFNCDHIDIAKPVNDNDSIYLAVREILLSVVSEQEVSEALNIKKLPAEDTFDNECFVLKLILGEVHHRNIKSAKQYFYAAEFLRKLVISKKLMSLHEFESLYRLIEGLYATGFALYTSGKLKDGNALLAYVHERIEAEDQQKLKTMSQIKFMHKTGMLHQLANDPNSDIWWADGHTIEDINELRKQKQENQ